MPDRLSALDTSFLHLEGPTTPMHISSLAIYEGGPAPVDDIRTSFERRLHLVPRFRQRVADVPFGTHRPVWTDDPAFELDHHVRHVAVPDGMRIEDLCGLLLSQPLDRTRPLWEMWVIDRLPQDRFALLSKTHHAMWDGVSGADAHAVLLDVDPAAADPDPEPWQPHARPTPIGLIGGALRDRITDPIGMARGAVGALGDPVRTVRSVMETGSGAASFVRAGLFPAPRSPLNAYQTSGRRYAFLNTRLEDAKNAKRTAGATINDVALAATAGALRQWFIDRGMGPRDLRAMVPVSVRRPHEKGTGGNRVAMLLVPLPVREIDPLARLEIVASTMRDLKGSGQAQAGEVITRIAGFAPPQAVAALSHLQSRRLFNLLVTNIPGPPFPLYLRGRRLLELYPQAPLSAGQGLAIALMSYAGSLGFGLLADHGIMPDLDAFAASMRSSLAEVAELTRPDPPDASIAQVHARPVVTHAR